MTLSLSFFETPNGPLAVVHVQPQQLADEITATRLRRSLSRSLGGLPVILRCRIASSVSFSADDHLRGYAVDPVIDCLPVMSLSHGLDLASAA
jgi:hypothetical protein